MILTVHIIKSTIHTNLDQKRIKLLHLCDVANGLTLLNTLTNKH